MKISPINNNYPSLKSADVSKKSAVLNCLDKKDKIIFESTAATFLLGVILYFAAFRHPPIKNVGGKILLSAKQNLFFKKEMKAFSQDIKYRKELMKAMGLKSKDCSILRPIVGPKEYENIVKEFSSSAEFYSPGRNLVTKSKDGFDMSGRINRTFRAGLHNHTVHSDGRVSVKERLDEAAKYADEVAEKILNNPQAKAKHAPFTIAITDHDTVDGCKEALNVISADPWKYRNLRVILGCEMSVENKLIQQRLKKPLPVHMLVHCVDPYSVELNNFVKEIKAFSVEVPKYADMGEAMEIIKNQKQGYMSIAHPALCNVGESLVNPSESFDAMNSLFKTFKEKGGDRAFGAELYYHYFGEVGESKTWLDKISFYAKQNGLYPVGGIDSHGKSIFYSDL